MASEKEFFFFRYKQFYLKNNLLNVLLEKRYVHDHNLNVYL